MALFVQETPKMGGVPVDKGGREEHLNFEHKEFAISVQFRPDEHVASSAHAAARSKTTNHFDKLAKNDPLAQPAFWGKLGALLHSGQASHLTELRGQLKEAMKTKQAEVSNAERSVEQKPKLAKVKVPRLNLETAMKIQASKSLTTRSLREDYDEGSISPSGPFSARVLREALTDRGKRQQWLASTKEFSKDSILEPYAVTERQATAFKLLAKQEMVIEEQVVRGESQRISDILHRVNVSLMKGTATLADPGARERHNTMEDIQQELKEQTDKLRNIIKSSATIDGDERFLKSTPHRYKFTKANQEGTAHTRLVFRGPQYTRNAVIWTDKSDSALYNKAKLSFKLAEQVEDGLIRRALRAQAASMNEELKVLVLAQQQWLTAIVLAQFCSRARPIIAAAHSKTLHFAKLIQRCWRLFKARIKDAQDRARNIIIKWLGGPGRLATLKTNLHTRARGKAAKIIKTFMNEMKHVTPVMPYIHRYKRAVLKIQREIRATVERIRATRAKHMAQYERIEKNLVNIKVREKLDFIREQEKEFGKAAEPGIIDWFKLYDSGDYSKLRTSTEVKSKVIRELMKAAFDSFSMLRKQHNKKMKDFRRTFRRAIGFRTHMYDFLSFIGQEHRLKDIDSLAEKDQQAYIKSLTKELPIPPKWSDNVSEERMRFAVMHGLNMASKEQIYVKLLLAESL